MKKSVLITGCDTGFGNLTAKTLSKDGYHVFAGCLTKTGVESFHEFDNITAFLLDVTKEEDISRTFELVKTKMKTMDGWGLRNKKTLTFKVPRWSAEV